MIELNQIYLGDCLEVMKNIPDKSINLICTDLPYAKTKNHWDISIDLKKLWEQYERIIKPDGNILLFGTGLFAFKLALSNEKLFRYDLVWYKSKCGSPLTAKYMPLKKHELILVFGKPAAYYQPQLIESIPYKRKYTEYKKNNHRFGIKGVEIINSGTRHPSTILEYKMNWRRQDQIHPTQKPVALIEFIIKSYSKEKDIVLDSTSGSSTVAIAALKNNRNFIMIEKDKLFYNISLSRIEYFKENNKDYYDK